MSARKVLMILGGVGLGNATRAHAILGELRAQGFEVDVATSGPALCYFRRVETGASCLFELPGISYGGGRTDGGLNLWALPRAAARFLTGGVRAFFRLRRLLDAGKYQAVIIDSNYNLASRFSGLPLISVNNSDRIFAHRRFLRGAGLGVALHFWLVEAFDYAFQRLVPDLVLSPWPVAEARRGKFRGIGLIVRPSQEPPKSEPGSVLVMGSGSGLGRIDCTDIPGRVYIFGLQGTVVDYDTLPALARSDAAVINGGFSALSEALVHRKRILALPLHRHAEQNIVCEFLRARGWLEVHSGGRIAPAVESLLKKENPLADISFAADGAHEAAQAIAEAAVAAPARQAVAHPYRGGAKDRRPPLATADRPPVLDAR